MLPYDTRLNILHATIGAWAWAISSTTAIFWTWANLTGRLPEPPRVVVPAIEEDTLLAEPPVAS